MVQTSCRLSLDARHAGNQEAANGRKSIAGPGRVFNGRNVRYVHVKN